MADESMLISLQIGKEVVNFSSRMLQPSTSLYFNVGRAVQQYQSGKTKIHGEQTMRIEFS